MTSIAGTSANRRSIEPIFKTSTATTTTFVVSKTLETKTYNNKYFE